MSFASQILRWNGTSEGPPAVSAYINGLDDIEQIDIEASNLITEIQSSIDSGIEAIDRPGFSTEAIELKMNMIEMDIELARTVMQVRPSGDPQHLVCRISETLFSVTEIQSAAE